MLPVEAWICQQVQARLASLALLFGRSEKNRVASDEERRYIEEKILEEKTELAKKIVFVAGWILMILMFEVVLCAIS